jgi:hypothetical protein
MSLARAKFKSRATFTLRKIDIKKSYLTLRAINV